MKYLIGLCLGLLPVLARAQGCAIQVSGAQNGTVNTQAVAVWDKSKNALTLECRKHDGTPVVTLGARMNVARGGTYSVGRVRQLGHGGTFAGSVTLLYGPNDGRNAVYETSAGAIQLGGQGANIRAVADFAATSYWGHKGDIHVRVTFLGPVVNPYMVVWK